MARQTSRRPGRSSRRTGPGRSTCWASRASSCSTPSTTAGCTTSEHGDDVDLAYAAARAHNRGHARVLLGRSAPAAFPAMCRWATRSGPWRRPADASGRGRRRFWWPRGARRVLAQPHVLVRRVGPGGGGRLPVVFHVGGTGDLIDQHLLRQRPADPARLPRGRGELPLGRLHGHPAPPAQTLATMIFDGVLEAFPELRIGVIEQGAIWVPSWLRQMESAFDAFGRHEERLQSLSLRPSEYVHRQVRFTPYPTEDVGWIVREGGAGSRDVLVRLSRTSRGAEGLWSASRHRWGTRARTCGGRSTRTTSCSSWAARRTRWRRDGSATGETTGGLGSERERGPARARRG